MNKVNVNVTRTVSVPGDKIPSRLTGILTDPNAKQITIKVMNNWQETEITLEREDFLDFVVELWPENVAYQFEEDNESG